MFVTDSLLQKDVIPNHHQIPISEHKDLELSGIDELYISLVSPTSLDLTVYVRASNACSYPFDS
jgi:hypothetical protein